MNQHSFSNSYPHKLEAADSWETHTARILSGEEAGNSFHRRLHKKTHTKGNDKEHREKKLKKLYDDPGIQHNSMHGMMIDAGSSGSRMHVYEFARRVLEDEHEVKATISGRKLSYPGTDSRWTDRLRPGLASLGDMTNEELIPAIIDYLSPLLEFAEVVLRKKRDQFHQFPIYLKATAGFRTLDPISRSRVISAVRIAFSNKTFCPFMFEDEQARVISGEEEAIYGWAGVNFVLGSLLENSEGSGTVIDPKFTYGALEMGGASSQISFYQKDEDIMSNLYKLQIGQGKHWNVYAHSFLYYGIGEAWNRMGAFLAAGGRGKLPVYNPCLAGGVSLDFSSDIHFKDGYEYWANNSAAATTYSITLINHQGRGDYKACASIVLSLIEKKDQNAWCNFAHHGECSFSNVYQPKLPSQSRSSGEFLAYSNYYYVFDFLQIPSRSSLYTLEEATKKCCSMSREELDIFNHDRYDEDITFQMCFRATYVLNLLHKGHGFRMEDNITAVNVVKGQKIGWALGSMLYEINTLPWSYVPKKEATSLNQATSPDSSYHSSYIFALLMLVGIVISMLSIFSQRRNRLRKSRDLFMYSSVPSKSATNLNCYDSVRNEKSNV